RPTAGRLPRRTDFQSVRARPDGLEIRPAAVAPPPLPRRTTGRADRPGADPQHVPPARLPFCWTPLRPVPFNRGTLTGELPVVPRPGGRRRGWVVSRRRALLARPGARREGAGHGEHLRPLLASQPRRGRLLLLRRQRPAAPGPRASEHR